MPIVFGAIDHDLQHQIELKIKIYPILSLWVCPRDKSPPIVVRFPKFGPKMYLNIVKVLIYFGMNWPWSSVSFLISNLLFSTKLSVPHSIATVCIYLVRPSPMSAPYSTWHCKYTDSFMHVDRVAPQAVKQSSCISWWDYPSSMSRWLGDWHWILQAPIGVRQIIYTIQAVILYANIWQPRKQQ